MGRRADWWKEYVQEWYSFTWNSYATNANAHSNAVLISSATSCCHIPLSK